MEKIKVKEIVKACKGRLLQGDGGADVKGIFIDSRLVEAHGAFFALKGERVDGHDFLVQAIEKACSVVVVEKRAASQALEAGDKSASSFGVIGSDVAVIQVEDTEKALGDLAQYYLEKFQIKKVAVTGSTGKTTTKEMLFHILSTKYKSLRNLGNYNNLIGLPLTAFNLDSSYEAVVFEMGMDRLGEIHRMAEIVKPDIALVTNVGLSHLSRLETRENILKAKGEVRDFLTEKDSLIINGQDKMMKAWLYEQGPYELVTVGACGASSDSDKGEPRENEAKQVCLSDIVDLGEAGVEFTYSYGRGEADGTDGAGSKDARFKLTVPGLHNVMNAAMAITAALKLDVDIKLAQEALLDFKSEEMRLNIIDCKDFKIIDDTYNASPDSVKAAIDVLAGLEGKRRIAILGDMFELGSQSVAYHREIGGYAFQKGLDVVLSVGENAKEIVAGAKEKSMNAVHFHNKEMLITVLSQWIRKGDLVLVKGSRGMAMEEIVDAIKAMKI